MYEAQSCEQLMHSYTLTGSENYWSQVQHCIHCSIMTSR